MTSQKARRRTARDGRFGKGIDFTTKRAFSSFYLMHRHGHRVTIARLTIVMPLGERRRRAVPTDILCGLSQRKFSRRHRYFRQRDHEAANMQASPIYLSLAMARRCQASYRRADGIDLLRVGAGEARANQDILSRRVMTRPNNFTTYEKLWKRCVFDAANLIEILSLRLARRRRLC